VGSALRVAYPDAVSDGFMMPLAPVKLQGVANAGVWVFVIMCLKYGIVINLVLFTLNILPIPPLDGYGVLESLAPKALTQFVASLRSFGFILLIVLIVSGAISYLLIPAIVAALVLNVIVGGITGWG
jgi:Zn-dependent protease